LDASTVTPGRTAPDVSLTMPAIDCACASAGSMRTQKASANALRTPVTLVTIIMDPPPPMVRSRWYGDDGEADSHGETEKRRRAEGLPAWPASRAESDGRERQTQARKVVCAACVWLSRPSEPPQAAV